MWNYICWYMNNQSSWKWQALMICIVTHCIGCISTNTRPHQLHWDDWEMGSAVLCMQIHAQNAVGWLALFRPVEAQRMFATCCVTSLINDIISCTRNMLNHPGASKQIAFGMSTQTCSYSSSQTTMPIPDQYESHMTWAEVILLIVPPVRKCGTI